MMAQSHTEIDESTLLLDLMRAASVDDARTAADRLVANYAYAWMPVGANEANYGVINMGSDPGVALIERVTNAIDSILEREAERLRLKGGKSIDATTPREAVDEWFGVKGGRVSNIPVTERSVLADNVRVCLTKGAKKAQPTVEVRDSGVGLRPNDVPSTILSIGGSNKLDKRYVAGAYGQGGSTVFAFAPEGSRIMSRRQTDLLGRHPDEIAVTLVRFDEMDPLKNKSGCYLYLVNAAGKCPGAPAADLPTFEPGTSVVHYNFALGSYSQKITQLTSSLWYLMQNSLFDPVLPFWIEDHRNVKDGKGVVRRTIAGNHYRLNRGLPDDDSEGVNETSKVEHDGSVAVMLEHKGSVTTFHVNYWVLRSDSTKDGAPISSYVDKNHPITYTNFGQTHGLDHVRLIKDRLNLPYLVRYLVVQVELDDITPALKRDILSTTRDRLKETEATARLRDEMIAALREDEDLRRLDGERKEALLSTQSDKDKERIKARFARMMEDLPAGVDASAKGGGSDGKGRRKNDSKPTKREPLETRKEPTYIRVGNAAKPVAMRKNRHAVITLESDAPDKYLGNHVHANLLVLFDPDGKSTVKNQSDFRGGRARVSVSPTDGANVGDVIKVRFVLMKPNKEQIKCDVSVVVESSEERRSEKGKNTHKASVPDPIPITKEGWGELDWNEKSVCEVKKDEEGVKIFVNVDNIHLVKLLKGARYSEVGLARMKNNFVIYSAFYGWLQFAAHQDLGPDAVDDGGDSYKVAEHDRLAQTVIQAISGDNSGANDE